MIDYKPKPANPHRKMDTVIGVLGIVMLTAWVVASFVNHTTLWNVI